MKIHKTPELDDGNKRESIFPPPDVIEVLEQKNIIAFDLVTYDKDIPSSERKPPISMIVPQFITL